MLSVTDNPHPPRRSEIDAGQGLGISQMPAPLGEGTTRGGSREATHFRHAAPRPSQTAGSTGCLASPTWPARGWALIIFGDAEVVDFNVTSQDDETVAMGFKEIDDGNYGTLDDLEESVHANTE